MAARRSRFGRALVEVLAAAEMTQRGFAKHVGVVSGTLRAVISGKRKPKIEDLEPWADALGLRGATRLAFLEEGWLALSPPQVAGIVDGLRAELAKRAR